MNNSINLL